MRKYERADAPNCLTPDVIDAWTESFRNTGYISWSSNACRRRMRELLYAANDERCAFCDGLLGTESLETIEHFCPKRGPFARPDLAFVWTNLFPACDVCQIAKGTKWIEHLLRPDAVDYDFDRYFCCNFLTGSVDPLPRESGGDPERAEAFLAIFNLRDTKRCKVRLKERRDWQRARAAGDTLDDYNYRFFMRDD